MSDDRNDRSRDMLVPLNVRTYRIAIANGILGVTGFRLADRTTVVPLLVHKLSGTAWMVGLVLGLWWVVRTLVQVAACRSLDALDYKKPAYILSAITRGGAYVAIALVMWFGDAIPKLAILGVLVLGLMVHSAGGALAGLAFNDILAKSIPTTKRGSMQMWRRLGALTIVFFGVTPFVRWMIGGNSPFEFPHNFAALFAASVAISTLAWTLFSQVREPRSRTSGDKPSWRQHIRRGVQFVRTDSSYRRVIRIRLLVGLAAAIRPFFIVFATQVWGLPDEVAATFLAIQVAAEFAGAAVVGHISDRLGNRSAIFVALCAIVVACVAAVAAGSAEWNVPITLLVWTVNLQIVILGAAFVGSGIFMASLMIGYTNYLMDIAPEEHRPSYMGFGTAFMLPLAVAPLAFGWAADLLGYLPVFIAGLVLSLGALYLFLQLPEPRDDLDDGDLEQFRRPPTADDGEVAGPSGTAGSPSE
ncbi:MAG: MFS transporter, partial [Armatimonadia bacterium]|nr:MFS transporter [Armatimonadia bacterium]